MTIDVCPLQSSLDDATDDWGIKVERVEIKDVKLPLQLQRAMAAEAEATREARAKVRAHGEAHVSRRARAAKYTGYSHAFKASTCMEILQKDSQ